MSYCLIFLFFLVNYEASLSADRGLEEKECRRSEDVIVVSETVILEELHDKHGFGQLLHAPLGFATMHSKSVRVYFLSGETAWFQDQTGCVS